MSNVILISYDNQSHLPFFPLNLFYLAGALVKARHEVKIIYQDLHHFPDSEITRIIDAFTFKNNKKADVIGLGFCAGYYQYGKAKSISNAVNQSIRRRDFLYVLGGHGPAADPDFFIRKLGADAVVIGDGEEGILEVAENGAVGRVACIPVDQAESPLSIYPHFPIDIYRLIRMPKAERTDFCFPIIGSRGCRWSCSFCYRMREGFYERPVPAIMDEIRYLHRNFGINYFQFADELTMSSERRVGEICESILRLSFKIKWDLSGRLNFAKRPILDLMKRSGAQYVNYGIESLSQSLLNSMGKGLTFSQIYQGVEDTLASGLSPGLNLLWGFPGDTKENLEAAVEFLIKYDPCDELRTIRPVTPYPGTLLFKKAVEMGLVKDTEDFYENLHKNSDLLTVNFMSMPTAEAHAELFRANHALIINYMGKRTQSTLDAAGKLYLLSDTSFRGFRAV